MMRLAQLCLFNLLGIVLALRSTTPEEDSTNAFACPTAKQRKESEQIFEINALAFKDAKNVWQEWRLYRFPNCSEEVGSATILPKLDERDPENQSTVSISIQDGIFGNLFVCSPGATECMTHLRPAEKSWMFVDLLSGVLSSRSLKGFHSLSGDLVVLFELVVLVSFCILIVIIFWSIGLIVETCKENPQRRWGLASDADVSSKHCRLPSTTEIMSQTFIDVLFFVLGCGLFVLEGERFFRIYLDDSGLGFVLVIAFPLLFGCGAVMRIFLATARVHLYYESLRSGILLKLKPVTLLRDPLLMWFWLGIIITVGNAAKAVFCDRSHWMDDLKALVVFVSPLYYMTSSLVDIQFAENQAVKQHCIVALEGISKDSPITLGGDDSIVPVEESGFVTLARQRKNIQPPAPDCPTPQARRSLTILDFQWVGFVALQRAKGVNRVLLRFFNPQLICAILCLGLFSLAVCFKTMTESPRLVNLRVIGADLSKDFNPSLTEYAMLVHTSQHFTGVAAKVNPTEAKQLRLRTSSIDNKEKNRSVTTSTGLAEAISVDQDRYPTKVDLEVKDTFHTTGYRLEVFKYGVVPESLVLSGEHVTGVTFQRCIPWGYLSRDKQPVRIPKMLKNLDVSISYAHFVVDLPAQTRRDDGFTTLYEKNVSREHCLQKQAKEQVAATQFSGAGCYTVMQPRWSTCRATRADLTEDFLKQVNARIHGQLCVLKDASLESDCQTLTESGSSQLTRKLNTSEDNNTMPWWKDSQLQLELFMSYNASQIVLVDGQSSKSRAQDGIQLTSRAFDLSTMFAISVMADGKLVGDTFFSDMSLRNFFVGPYWHLMNPDEQPNWNAFIVDTDQITNAEYLEIAFVSRDLDCYLESLQGPDGEELKLGEINTTRFCAIGAHNDSEVCDGWEPTRHFVIPMKVFVEQMRKHLTVDQYVPKSLSWMIFNGHPVCHSTTRFEEDFPLHNLSLTVQLTEKPKILPVAWMPGQHVESASTYCGNVHQPRALCNLNVLNGGDLKRTSPLYAIIINTETGCTMENFKTQAHQRFVNESELKEACDHLDILSNATMCGGTLESVAVALDWVVGPLVAEADYHLSQNIEFFHRCPGKIWIPYPVAVDVSVHNEKLSHTGDDFQFQPFKLEPLTFNSH